MKGYTLKILRVQDAGQAQLGDHEDLFLTYLNLLRV